MVLGSLGQLQQGVRGLRSAPGLGFRVFVLFGILSLKKVCQALSKYFTHINSKL